MQRCENCGVTVNGAKACCPLCQGALTGSPEPKLEAFPQLRDNRREYGLVRRLINFLAILGIAVCLVVEFAFTRGQSWVWFAVGGIISGWLSLRVVLTYRGKIYKTVSTLMLLITILGFIWDRCTGWYGWSIDWLLPIATLTAILGIILLALILRPAESDFLIHLIIAAFYGVIPFILLIVDKLAVRIPSFICSVVAFLILAGFFAFKTKSLLSELSRRMHI